MSVFGPDGLRTLPPLRSALEMYLRVAAVGSDELIDVSHLVARHHELHHKLRTVFRAQLQKSPPREAPGQVVIPPVGAGACRMDRDE